MTTASRPRATRQILILIASGALTIAGVTTFLAVSPRLTLFNSGIRLAYPFFAGTTVAVCALGLAALAALRLPLVARLALLCLALLLLLAGIERLTYRLEADPDGMRITTATGRVALPWRDLTSAETTGEELRLSRADGSRATISLAELSPQQRVAVTRTIERRVSEASGLGR
jgi:hypothetical protein